MRIFQHFLGSLRLGLLFRRMKEDRSAVLSTPIRTLPVHLRGIVILPKDFQQIVILHLGGIKLYLYGFRVAGAICADFFVGWIARYGPRCSQPVSNSLRESGETLLLLPRNILLRM